MTRPNHTWVRRCPFQVSALEVEGQGVLPYIYEPNYHADSREKKTCAHDEPNDHQTNKSTSIAPANGATRNQLRRHYRRYSSISTSVEPTGGTANKNVSDCRNSGRRPRTLHATASLGDKGQASPSHDPNPDTRWTPDKRWTPDMPDKIGTKGGRHA